MSQGLINPQLLELVSMKQQTVTEIVLAPSYFIKEAWELPDYRHFLGVAISNLLENGDPCIQDDQSELAKTCLEKKVLEKARKKDHCTDLWCIREDTIKE